MNPYSFPQKKSDYWGTNYRSLFQNRTLFLFTLLVATGAVLASLLFYVIPYPKLFIFGIALFLTALILYSPYYGLLLTLFVEFSGVVWGFEIPMGFFAVVLLTTFSWVLQKMISLKWEIFWDSLFIWIIVFLAIALASTFVAMNKTQSLTILFLYFKLGLYYFLIVQILDTPKKAKGAVVMIIFATLFSVIFGLIGMFFPLPFLGSSMQTWRFRGLTSDPNILGIHLLIIIPFLFLLFFHEKNKMNRILIGILFLFSILGLVATFSRSSTIGLAFVLFYLFYHKRREKIIIVLSAVMLFLAIYFVPVDFWERILSVGNINQDPSLRWRAELYRGAWNLFIHHPILGIGVGNFVLQSHVFVAQHLAVHNTFLEVATETGFLGFLLFVGIVAVTIFRFVGAKNIFKKNGATLYSLFSDGFLVGLLGVFVVSFFYSIEEYFVLWTILALASVFYYIAKKEYES